ncbi:hypothetical protein [Limnohabitans sp.]|uniref:hypothetical protein n=1 Tax=Limnohabitans sp. TaxID=1907725 RepID=UPI0037BF1578
MNGGEGLQRITDRGSATHVLMSDAAYQAWHGPAQSVADAHLAAELAPGSCTDLPPSKR